MNMKKEYISPLVKPTNMDLEALLCGSGVNGNFSGETVGYGGVDENGEKDPDANYSDSFWDDVE